MQQETIYVPNGDFWGKFEELGDQTYGQAVILDEALKDKVIAAATECELIGNYAVILHWWKRCCCSVPRTLVMARDIRDGRVYGKVILIYNSRSEKGFKSASDKCEKEFLFVAKD